MNLHLKPFSLRQLLIKIVTYAFLFYLLVIVASLTITGYIFLNLDGYRLRIEKTFYNHTGYQLKVGSIQTKLSNTYLPEIVIKDVQLINPINSKQSMQIKLLDFVFSYSSIWDLEPIFNKILIDGTTINLEYDPSGNIFVNGINVNNPDRQTLENTKNSPVDLEKWALKQHNIILDHVNLTYLDLKNGLPKVELNNLKIGLEKSIWSDHRLYLDIYGKSFQNMLEADLTWHGGKFEDWQKWKTATLKIKSVNGTDNIVSTIQQYLPVVPNLSEFNATTALEANMKEGKLQNLHANFDINNFKLALADANLVNFPKLGGNIDIRLLNNQYYSIQAQNLMIVTSAGALFDNAKVTGGYEVDKTGQVQLSNTNLMAINNLLSLFQATEGININGNIRVVKFNWDGALLKPTSFQVYAAFDDISLNSSKPALPSLSHVSGDITIRNNSGHLNLKLKNSVLNYDKIFLIPYVFKSLDSQIDWNIDSNKKLTVTLNKTNLETKDFSGWAEGSYHTEPNNPDSIGYLDLRAHVNRVQTSKVGDYLPKAIPMSVHQWLNMALIGGYGANAELTLKGPLLDFPYRDGKTGIFYITADIDNAKLQYVKDWPTLDNIRGQFILKNTNITVKANSALVEGNYLDPSVVIIPDYAATDGVYLTANGKAHGSTANFMNYLKKTPISALIGHIPEKVIAKGNGNINLYLKVPFKEPKSTEVKGSYTFNNNNIKLEMPVPELTSVNGDLFFTHRGVNISNLSAQTLGSNISLSATTDKSGKIDFNVNSQNLDYQKLASFYLPPLVDLISGKSPTQIRFEVSKHGITSLNATSNLVGVKCEAASPLFKTDSQSTPMAFNLVPYVNDTYLMTFSYDSQLKGQVILGKNSPKNSIKLALGRNVEYLSDPDPSAVMTINANPESANIEDWLSTVKKITTAIAKARIAKQDSESSTLKSSTPVVIKNSAGEPEKLVFPVQIQLNSKNISFARAKFGSGSANIFVDAAKSYFNLYTPIVSGIGEYQYSNNKLKLVFDKYMLFKSPQKKKFIAESDVVISFVNGSTAVVSQKVPDVDITIKNLFYQNHNLGKVTAIAHQDKSDLYLESGVLSNKDAEVKFSGVNYCFGCGRDASYVDFQFDAKVNNAGNIVYNLDLGRIIDKGNGTINGAFQWNGGFQDFNILQTVGSINASLSSGKFLKVDPGLWGGLLSIINLQGVFEVGSLDVQDLFKKGFFFNQLDVNADILTTQLELKRVYMTGPMAKVNSSGKVNFASNTVDAYLSVTPKLGVAVAVTAGVVTLNPIVGLGVYLGELLFGDPQNKLFTFAYHITGNLSKPKIEKTSVTQQFVKNVNSAVGNSNGGAN